MATTRWNRAEKDRFCYYHCSLSTPLAYTADRLTSEFRRPITEDTLQIMKSKLRRDGQFPPSGCKFKRNFPLEKVQVLLNICFYAGGPKLTAADTATFASAAIVVNETVDDPYGNQLTAESARWMYWCLEYEGATYFSVQEQMDLELAYEFDMINAGRRSLTLEDLASYMNRLGGHHRFERRHIAFLLKHGIEMRTFERRLWATSDLAVAWFNSMDNGKYNVFWHGKALVYESLQGT